MLKSPERTEAREIFSEVILFIWLSEVKKEWGSDVIHCDLVHSLDERDSTIENVFITKGDSAPWASKLQSTGKISTVVVLYSIY